MQLHQGGEQVAEAGQGSDRQQDVNAVQLRMAERALLAPVLHTHQSARTAAVRRALGLRQHMLHFVRQVSSFTQQRLLDKLLPACLQVSI